MLYGDRHKIWVSGGEGISVGVGHSWSSYGGAVRTKLFNRFWREEHQFHLGI